MKYFTTFELVRSLAVPVFTAVYGIVGLLGYITQSFEGFNYNFFFPLAMLLIGGVLPILMTLFGGVHTERYFLKRVIEIVVCFVIMQYVILQMSVTVLSFIIMTAFLGAKIVFELLKIQDDETTGRERAVMLLSDPIYWLFANDIYNTVCYLAELPAV